MLDETVGGGGGISPKKTLPQQPPTVHAQHTLDGAHFPTDVLGADDLYCMAAELRGVVLCFNIRAQRMEWRDEFGCWRHADEDWFDDLRDEAQKKFTFSEGKKPKPAKFTHDGMKVCLGALRRRLPRDHFRDYLELNIVQGRTWDGTERIDNLLQSVFRCKESKLNGWASRYLFLGPLQRTYQPGCKLDEIPVLIGPQGIGKSALLRSLFQPHEQREFFRDHLDLSANDGRKIEATAGAVLVEASEMVGRKQTEIERLKNYLSRQEDVYRLAYRRDSISYPRSFVIVATSNDKGALPNDPSGNRRFVAVWCPDSVASVEDMMNEKIGEVGTFRDQCWVEAIQRYLAGERANLPRDLMPSQAEVNERFRDTDEALEERLRGVMAGLETDDKLPILSHIQERLYQEEAMRSIPPWRIKRALENLGYVKRKTKKGWLWLK